MINTQVLIVGNGPAGISASLYTARAGINTTVIGKDIGALAKTDKIENYYGFENPISGKELISAGIAQSTRVGATIIQDEVVSIQYNGKLVVITKNEQFQSDAVVLATGSARSTPTLQGITEFEGKGVSYCAVCDAFFYKGKDVCVLGSGDYALHEAMDLLPIVKSVTVITNGKELTTDFPKEITINTKKIKAIKGTNVVECVTFDDESVVKTSGVFIAIGVASSGDLAKKLGSKTNGSRIVVDQNMSTNIPGLFAAGDCIGGLLQISKAVSDGAKAGTEVIKYIRSR